MRTLILAASAAALLAGAAASQAQVPAPADIVKAWDTNGDGVVDKSEWVAAGRPAERFDLVDSNHDGKVTAEELAAAMAQMRARQGGAAPAPAPSPAPPK